MAEPSPLPGSGAASAGDRVAAAVAWSLLDVLWAGLLAIGLVLGIAALATLAKNSLPLAAGSPQRAWASGLLLALSETAFVLPVWLFAVLRRRARWRDLGLRGFQPLLGCLAVLGAFLLAIVVNVAWSLVLFLLGLSGQPNPLPLFGTGPWGLLLAFVSLSIIAPLAEELFFRGFIFPALRQRMSLWLAIGLNAALFALLHLTPTVLPPLLALGAMFCLLYHYTGSLWPGILLHSAVNTFSLLLLLGTHLLSGQGF